MGKQDDLRQATRALHAPLKPRVMGAPVAPSIVTSNSYYSEVGKGLSLDSDAGPDETPYYARWGAPTVALLEARLATLEGGEAGLCFASGMGAISGVLFTLLKAGDQLVITDTCYPGAAEFARGLSRYGVTATAVNEASVDEIARAIRPNTRVVYIETPANPILRLADIPSIAKIAHAANAKLIVDSTIATPIALTGESLASAEF